MTELPSLPPLFAPSPTATQELTLARAFSCAFIFFAGGARLAFFLFPCKTRGHASTPPSPKTKTHAPGDALEHALLLDVATADDEAFERDAVQLRPYYTDARPLLPPSPSEGTARGLTLLRLLAASRLADFAAEAASLPPDVAAAPTPALALRLEATMAEGAYPSALAAARAPLADPAAGRSVAALEVAIRSEVAACAAAAYPSLALDDAAALLMLDGGAAAVQALAAEKGWAVRGGRVWFGEEAAGGRKGGGAAASASSLLPGPELLAQALTYARELERIV
jgi:hypothetical protein